MRPSPRPTLRPTDRPTLRPTESPTPYPTNAPTSYPTDAPTPYPTNGPTPYPTNGPTPSPTNDIGCDDTQIVVPDLDVPTTIFAVEFDVDEFNTEIIISLMIPDGAIVISIWIIGDGIDLLIPVIDPTQIIIEDGLTEGTFALIITFDAPQLSSFSVSIGCVTPAPSDSPTPYPTNAPTPYPTNAPTPYPTNSPTPSPTNDIACDDTQMVVPDLDVPTTIFTIEFDVDELNTEVIISLIISPDSSSVVSIVIIGPGVNFVTPVIDPAQIIVSDGLPEGTFSLIIIFDAPQLTPFTVSIDCLTPMPTLSPTFIARKFIYIYSFIIYT